MSDLKNKRIITVATTGAWPKKENNPNVPMTPEEIAEDVYACWKAGAAMAHLHMRDENGNGTMDKTRFAKTVELLRANHPDCDIIINMTTSGDLNATDETRQIHLKELHPEMGSFDCGSMNWLNTSLFINHPKFLEELGHNMQEWGVKPEIEAFDPGMIANAAEGRPEGSPALPVLHGLCKRHPRHHEEPDLHEGNHGAVVPRFHLVLLRCGSQRYGNAVRCSRSGRRYPRRYGR